MPGSSSFQHYCDQVCAHIRFAPDHETIRKELRATWRTAPMPLPSRIRT